MAVHDELSREPGKWQIRYGNVSSRGHNGLKSLVDLYGNDFYRFGVGIGRPTDRARESVADFVLSKIPNDDWERTVWDVVPQLRNTIETLRTAHQVDIRNGKLVTVN